MVMNVALRHIELPWTHIHRPVTVGRGYRAGKWSPARRRSAVAAAARGPGAAGSGRGRGVRGGRERPGPWRGGPGSAVLAAAPGRGGSAVLAAGPGRAGIVVLPAVRGGGCGAGRVPGGKAAG